MGLASVPLPVQALIGLELVAVLVDVVVEAHGLVVDGLVGRPSGRMQGRGLMGISANLFVSTQNTVVCSISCFDR
jgi:hypothetical protein